MVDVLSENNVSLSDLGASVVKLADTTPGNLRMIFATLKEFGKTPDVTDYSSQADVLIASNPQTIKNNFKLLSDMGRNIEEMTILDLCTIDLEAKAKVAEANGLDFLALMRQHQLTVSQMPIHEFYASLGIEVEEKVGGMQL